MKQVKDLPLQQPTHILHKWPKRRFKRRKIILFGKHGYWQGDLAQTESSLTEASDGVKYWLVFVDTFMRFAYVEPITSKTGYVVSQAFERVLQRTQGINPKNLSTDRGTDFHNTFFKNLMPWL